MKKSLCMLSLMIAGTCGMATGANALEQANGLAFNGLAFNGLAFNGLAFNGLAFNGLAFNGLAFNGTTSEKEHLEPASLILKDGTKIILR